MSQQLEALRRAKGKPFFGFFMEQGTGKSWTALAEAEELFEEGGIDVLIIIAPTGVHRNWVRREIPAHLSCKHIARAWASGAGQLETRRINELLDADEERTLKIFSVNIDAMLQKKTTAFIRKLCMNQKVMCVVDESSRIKNPKAKRTEAVLALRRLCSVRRLLSGTPITKAPTDIFAQFEFLQPGLLGTTSYRTFVAEYAELLPPTHPLIENIVRNNPRAAHAQMVAKNPDGTPRWKNLGKLKELVLPHVYRVLKRDCLDLPEKIYKTHPFQLSPAQRKAYKLMDEECRIELGGDADATLQNPFAGFEVMTVKQQAAMMKLQQITSSFVKLPTGGLHYVEADSGRLAALMEIVDDVEGKFIVWARFREEIASVTKALRASGRKVVEYHGDVSKNDREIAIDSFQDGDADVFVGQAQSGGIGLTLTAAETAIYFSRDFNLETRLQSEDRNHRIGTTKHVVYIDIIAEDTIDEAIIKSLRIKAKVAAEILGDQARSADG